MSTLVKQALAVAKKYPVFPTNDKMPCWSNKELGVAKGEGGYKIATQDPEEVKRLFSHPRAKEIAVPMGAMSGLLCVDVDTYKYPELHNWVEENKAHFAGTLCHKTRRGGLHFFFEHPGETIRFPATLRLGVDVKAVGNGYVCFPPTDGYKPVNEDKAKTFPMLLLEEAMRAKGGTGKVTAGSAYNDATDGELIEAIQRADDLYPALRTLSYRLAGRRKDDGRSPYTVDEQVEILTNVMDSSAAVDAGHIRHEDWQDRRSKIKDLVESATAKQNRPVMDAEVAQVLSEAESFIDTQKMLAASARPIGPQRETTTSDIEERVAARSNESISPEDTNEFISVNAASLRETVIQPIEWVVPGMIPVMGTVSLGGTSNVGKTRWLAALAALGASGDLDSMGLATARAFSTLWLANEERVDDIARRLKAVMLQHGVEKSEDISVRGKDAGMLRLVAVNEVGNPELDEDNIATIVTEARRVNAKMIFFDPYVTLSDAMDENSAQSAAMLTKAFILIATLTGAAVLHAHHTPKDRSKDDDWYRGDSGAWRGSGAIYSALDCGYTLSHWMPKGKDSRKSWKENYIDENLSRWIVLDTGKIREGKPLPSVIYELVGQEMAKGEGDPIGVCRVASEHEASNSMLASAVDTIGLNEVATAMVRTLGIGTHTNMTEVHKRMEGHQGWPDTARTEGKQKLLDWFGEGFSTSEGNVQVIGKKKGQTKWQIVISEEEIGD